MAVVDPLLPVPAYRGATLFKVIYGLGFGARRHRSWTWSTPAAIHAQRTLREGEPPRRYVLSVMDWAVDAVADYVDNVRPKFGFDDRPALWVAERGGRIKPMQINARFVASDEVGISHARPPGPRRVIDLTRCAPQIIALIPVPG